MLTGPRNKNSVKAKAPAADSAGSILESVSKCFSDTVVSAPGTWVDDAALSQDADAFSLTLRFRGDAMLDAVQSAPMDVFAAMDSSALPFMRPLNDFVDAVQRRAPGGASSKLEKKKSSTEPAAAAAAASEELEFDPPSLSALSPAAQRCYRSHTRELSVLLAILQRPTRAYSAVGMCTNYRNLQRKLSESNFFSKLVEGIEQIMQCLKSRQPFSLILLTRLLSLYVDILFNYVIQHPTAVAEEVGEGARPEEHAARLAAIVHDLTQGSEDAQPIEWRRCAVLLIVIVAKYVDRTDMSCLEKALRLGSGRSWVDFIVLAAVPKMSADEAVSSSKVFNDALQVIFTTTVYDTDISVLFRMDGSTQNGVVRIVKQTIGNIFINLWNTVSPTVWQYFSAPAFISAAKSCYMYAFTWPHVPVAVSQLIDFIRYNLDDTASKSSQPNIALGSDNREDEENNNARRSSSVRTLVAGALGVPERVASPSTMNETTHTSHNHSRAALQPADSYWKSPLRFQSARSRTLFYMTLHCYACATSLYHAEQWQDVKDAFIWRVPAASSSSNAVGNDTVNNITSSMNASRIDELGFPIQCASSNEVNLLTQCLDYLCILVKTPEFVKMQSHPSSADSELFNFFEASLSLLHAFLFLYPQRLRQVRDFAQRDLLDVFVSVTLARASLEYPSTTPYTQELTYDLVQRLYTAPPSLTILTDALLTPSLMGAIGSDPAVTRAVVADLSLYTYLALVPDLAVDPSRVLFMLCNLEPSVLLGTLEGTHLYALVLTRLWELLEGFEALTIPLMLQSCTAEQAKALLDRISEGTQALFRSHQTGGVTLCGSPIVKLLHMSLNLLAEVLRTTEAYEHVSTLSISSLEDSSEAHGVPASYTLLSILYCSGLPVLIYEECAQVVCSVVSRGHSIFPVMRAHLLRDMRLALAESIHASFKGDVGCMASAIRLEAMRVISHSDPSTLQYFTGPDCLSANKDAVELADLAIAKSLCAIISDNEASFLEKASALEVLINLGLTDALNISRALAILNSCLGEDKVQPYEACILAASASKYINVLLVKLYAKEATMTPKPSAKRAPSVTDSPLIGGVGRVKPLNLGSIGGEYIDTILRRGADLLQSATKYYETMIEGVYFPDNSYASGVTQGANNSTALAIADCSAGGGASMMSAIVPLSSVHTAANTTLRSTVNHSIYHTDAIPDVVATDEALEGRLFPLIAGEQYCFLEGNERLNVLASTLEGIRRLSTAIENSVWLSGRDNELTGSLNMGRSKVLLRASLRCAMSAKPSAPLLCRPISASVKQCLQLASAVAHVADLSNLDDDDSKENNAVAYALRQLVVFVEQSAMHRNMDVVNIGLTILCAVLPCESISIERVFSTVAEVIKMKKALVLDAENQAFMKHCAVLFAKSAPNTCPFHILVYLMPALSGHLQGVSHAIPAGLADGGDGIEHFIQITRCIKSILLHARDTTVLSLLPKTDIINMAAALGQLSTSAVVDTRRQVHRRQNWHRAWCALLDVLNTVLLVGGAGRGPYTAMDSGWVSTMNASICHLPRFLNALGSFTTTSSSNPEGQGHYFVWDVEEMELCTQMVGLLSAIGSPMVEVLPIMKRSFLHIHRYRLLHACVATDPSQETALLEAKAIESALMHMVRYQLSYFLAQPGHGSQPAGTPARVVNVSSQEEGLRADDALLTFDILRRFLLHQFQIIRKSGVPENRSPEASMESSVVTRSPSRGRGETESYTEDDTTGEPLLCLHADMRAIHMEITQMALSLYTLAAEEFTAQPRDGRDGISSSVSTNREVKLSTEKLQNALRNARHDMRRMDSPQLCGVLQLMQQRLKVVSSSL